MARKHQTWREKTEAYNKARADFKAKTITADELYAQLKAIDATKAQLIAFLLIELTTKRLP